MLQPISIMNSLKRMNEYLQIFTPYSISKHLQYICALKSLESLDTRNVEAFLLKFAFSFEGIFEFRTPSGNIASAK